MYARRGDDGGPALLLLHGLGATSEVWDGLIELLPGRWPGGWIAPDLPGHGRSEPAVRYSYGRIAAELAELLPAGRKIVVLGHSLGGALGLVLASGWFGTPVAAVCGLGIKVRWTPEEAAKAQEQAARPARVFASREKAEERWLKVAGLSGIFPAGSVGAGVAETDGGWRLALDQAAFGFTPPDMAGLLAACRAEVTLAAGENDPMCRPEHLRELTRDPVILPGLGHNAHVEDPAALLPLLEKLTTPELRLR